jgi:hypothetical protein
MWWGWATPAAVAARSMWMAWPCTLQLDEPTLREVARMTGGNYHQAGTAEQPARRV